MTAQALLSVVVDARETVPRVRVSSHDLEVLCARAEDVLSAYEIARCARMVQAPARMLRTAAHVLKREALAATLGLPPRDVPLVEPSDRPVLAASHAALRVSLSHTQGAIAIAVSLTPIGVDIETLERSNDTAAIARRYFAPGEVDAMRDDPEGLRFARLWTAKEALKKVADINLFEALARPMPPRPTPHDMRETFEAHGARFDVMQPVDGYVCAIARMTAR